MICEWTSMGISMFDESAGTGLTAAGIGQYSKVR